MEQKYKVLFIMIYAFNDIVSAVLISFFLDTRAYDVKVEVSQGTLIGTRHMTVFDRRIYFAFYGVPYAQPPLGKLRFKDPKEPKKWKRPFDAKTDYRGACAQAHIVHKYGVYGYEDCLHLNIYTPSIPKEGKPKRAVIVWVHGYAFTSSFSHIHGGDFFIDNDVVLMTVTHRIGPFGFLKLNQSSSDANMGLKDVVMALKWVNKNAKVFGGDKNKITVMGSGSAATYLSLLLTTKASRLFGKIILQSGSMYSPSLFLGDNELEKERLQEALVRRGVKDVNSAPTRGIIAASQKIYKNEEVINYQKPLIPFLPTIEPESNKSLLINTEQQFLNLVRSLSRKPILIGFNRQESISDVIPFLHNPRLLQTLAISFKYMVPFAGECQFHPTSETYKSVAEKIKTKYFAKGITVESFLRYATDIYKYPVYRFMKELSYVNGSKMYAYKFNYNGNFNAVKTTSMAGLNKKVKGASNGDEICYLLKCEPLWENYVKIHKNVSHRDRIFIKQITELWSNFAKTGDPTPHDNGIIWPSMSIARDSLFSIGRIFKMVHAKSEEMMFSFWNEIYKNYYSPEHCQNKHEEL